MQKLISYLEKIQLILGTAFLAVFVSVTLIQVITRYLGISATWTEEVAVNTFIWSMLLGASVMVREKQHFSFNLLDNLFSSRNKCFYVIFQDLIILTFCILCTVYSAEITQTFWDSRWVTIPSLKQGYAWLILPITFATMSIYLLEDIVKQLIKLRKGN
ncbi:TRAP-type C4-dicarboxylate transport system permease small subunit [Cricetibacter osteomyelitidis]|uniref:TRAP transporter small permease protein n=1 Tax=Cricetibacter osteomyelitidis TaxID=1521931 RepID=A0A4R2T134_9PAST|nr:TRAP transporter small permease [Cricetibacter osteomyelitidis]TCP95800.1 TRAP-type C4-dicarboxylate transport system permease small subunit [Cricetibacter osteomyelitidis]